MKRMLLAALALALLVVAPGVQAQPAPGAKLQVLVLPLTLDLEDGDGFAGFDAAKFYQILEQKAEQGNTRYDIVIPAAGDPRLAGLDLTQEPDPTAAVAVANKFGAAVVAWSKVQFRLEHQYAQPGTSNLPDQHVQTGDPSPQNLITVGGIARMGVVDVGTGKVLLQGPVAIFRSALTRANLGTGNFQDDVTSTTLQCAEDLATRIVEQARKSRASQ